MICSAHGLIHLLYVLGQLACKQLKIIRTAV